MSRRPAERLGARRADVLHQLRLDGAPMGVAEVASAVGLHPNTTRFHLDGLIESGLVRRSDERRSRPGRPRALYQAVAAHDDDHYQSLAATLVRHFAGGLPDRADRAVAAGRSWGDELRTERESVGAEPPVDRLVRCMTDLGYEPAFEEHPDPVVVLHHCPFLELTGAGPGVLICQLHLGLANGLLGPDQPWTATAIDPLVTPTTCLLHLTRTAGERRAGVG